jgi:hypothetical protein
MEGVDTGSFKIIETLIKFFKSSEILKGFEKKIQK